MDITLIIIIIITVFGLIGVFCSCIAHNRYTDQNKYVVTV